MTNKEYFISQLGFAASANIVEAALTDYDIIENETYNSSNKEKLKQAILQALKVLLSTPNTTQQSGETLNSLTYDRNAILERIKQIENELGITVNKPQIKSVNVW